MKFSCAIFSLLIFPVCFFGQDAHFTQFYSSPLQLNPSFAGSIGGSRLVAAYRNQWPNISGNYVTQYYSYDQHVNFMHGGVGLFYLRDEAGQGVLRTTRIGLIYSPTFLIAEKISIKPSLETTYFQNTIDWSKLTFDDMIDPRYGFIYNTKEVRPAGTNSGIDFSTGILVNTNKWNCGMAIHHLTRPDEGFEGAGRLLRKYTFHGSYIFSRNDSAKFSFAPALLVMNQQNFRMVLLSVNFKYKWLRWGSGYRTGDAILFMLGCNLKRFRVSYSYDLTVSGLGFQTGGTHEANISYSFNFKNKEGKVIPVRSIGF